MPDGALALRFDITALCAFDVHILARPDAAKDYEPDVLARAETYFNDLNASERLELEKTIIAGLPGSEEHWDRRRFLEAIQAYDEVGPDRLRANHIAFLEVVCPHAERLGLRLVVHPDDPPFPLFGLARVVSCAEDLDRLFTAVPSPANGLCFCVGSFGARPDNNLVAMIEKFAERIGFLHLRDVTRTAEKVFHEAAHLQGDADMFNIVLAIHRLSSQQGRRIPMRPDHGHQMLDDLNKSTNPGYSAIGRLKGLAELRGLEMGIARFEAAVGVQASRTAQTA
ncbi:hypothetical protein LTR94_025200 [Friedmanniomyces endolithicus]|nr:hypothetical protein LTR94_025200 [Friedmanniomyces endolithicus]